MVNELFCIRFKEVYDVRWFAFYDALQSVYTSWQPLAVYLGSQDANKDAKAVGIHKTITSANFLLTLHMLMDVIPILTALNLVNNTVLRLFVT